MASERKPTSAWQRYKKKKWLYSATYQQWKEAGLKFGFGSPEALAMACHHAKSMSVVNSACVAK